MFLRFAFFMGCFLSLFIIIMPAHVSPIFYHYPLHSHYRAVLSSASPFNCLMVFLTKKPNRHACSCLTHISPLSSPQPSSCCHLICLSSLTVFLDQKTKSSCQLVSHPFHHYPLQSHHHAVILSASPSPLSLFSLTKKPNCRAWSCLTHFTTILFKAIIMLSSHLPLLSHCFP